jgi:hypothetical protein
VDYKRDNVSGFNPGREGRATLHGLSAIAGNPVSQTQVSCSHKYNLPHAIGVESVKRSREGSAELSPWNASFAVDALQHTISCPHLTNTAEPQH